MTLDIRQCRIVISRRLETNEVNPKVTPFLYLKSSFQALQCRRATQLKPRSLRYEARLTLPHRAEYC